MFSPVNQIAATASLLLAWTNGLTEWILWSISIADFFLFCALGILRRGFGADAFTVPRLLRRIVTVVLCARRSPILVVHYVANSALFENVRRPETAMSSEVLARASRLTPA